LQFALTSRMVARLISGAALIFPLIALGEEFVGPPAPPPPPDVPNVLDTPRDYVSRKFVSFVGSVDRFFGDDRNYQEANDSVLQMDITRVIGYGGGRRFVTSIKANVRLPTAEQKLHLLFETDPDKNSTVDPKQTQAAPISQPSTPQSYAAALRIENAKAERWHFSADGGIKFAGLKNSTPFVRARASLAVPVEQWRVKVAETLFWFNTIGAGESTQLDFERSISEPLLFRATSTAVWLNNTQNFDLRQDLTLFDRRSERTAVLYQASVIGMSQPKTQVTEYVLLALYRYRLHREWMFLEVSPQLHFPRALNFHTNSMLSVRLEMLFDESK